MNDSPKQPLANTDWHNVLDVLAAAESGSGPAFRWLYVRYTGLLGFASPAYIRHVQLEVQRLNAFRNPGAWRR
jgi:hypothetical protein